MSTIREVALALTRAQHTARAEGRADDARAIGAALTALLAAAYDADDRPSSEHTPSHVTGDGTRIGIGSGTL